ncbi:MAG: membrane-bound lytic murein transglycosylase MltF [Gammaproteobacteria bacterium]
MARIALLALLALALSGCGGPTTQLQQVKRSGELVVVTRNGPTTYYEGPNGPAGFEYDLAKMFADYLGVSLKIKVADNVSDILPMVIGGKADLAAAGLAVTSQRATKIRFGPSYYQVTPQLIYRVGTRPPSSLDELDGHLEVVAGSSNAALLRRLKATHPLLSFHTNPNADSDQLLYLVYQQLIDYTVADSNMVAINQQYYPELHVAFDVSKPRNLAWAFPSGPDDSLYRAAVRFFAKIREDHRLEQAVERNFGHVQDFDYVGTVRYIAHIHERLPAYEPLFKAAAEQTGLDWRLLAAIGYQESHWNPKAISPTGVRGIMMLTRRTMAYLGLDNRTDPEQSILGGARYFSIIKNRIPERIQEPDRTWLALAAYNIGFGHLEDARVLTERQGGDPDKWVDVKKYLPLLSQKKYYRHTVHGYARGREPVQYVENIRSYYDILVWFTNPHRPSKPEKLPALSIDSPVL